MAPPPGRGEWDLSFAEREAANGWEELCGQAPGSTRAAWSALRADPRSRSERQHPLKGDFAARSIGGRRLDQWQYEVTGAGRIWYCIDDDQQTVWLTLATVGHPSRTD